MTFLYILAGLAFLVVVVVAWKIKRRSKISAKDKRQLLEHWRQAQAVNVPTYKILEAEKVVDELFRKLGYQGSFADMMKKIGPRLKDKESVWRAHKLRNRIAHESNVMISEREAEQAVKAFERVIKQFL